MLGSEGLTGATAVWRYGNEGGWLWVGDEASARDASLLIEHGIETIVCLGSRAFHKDAATAFTYLEYPELLDMPSANLLGILPEAVPFIVDGLQSGSVLVHCVYGSSRSAALACASIISCSPHRQLQDVVTELVSVRPAIAINPGFLIQIQLYFDMQMGRVSNGTGRWFTSAMVSEHCASDVSHEQYKGGSGRVYVCKNCRSPLFQEDNIVDHRHPIVELVSNSWGRTSSKNNNSKQIVCDSMCTSYFIERLPWCKGVKDRDIGGQHRGKLMCPGSCKSKLGSHSIGYDSLECSCGAKIRPGWSITKSSVECRDMR